MVAWILVCVFVYVRIMMGGIKPDMIAIAVILYVVVMVGGILGSVFYMVNKVKKIYLARQTQIQAIFDRENQTYFQGREIRWLVGTYGAWIQIELDYIARKMNAGLNFPPAPQQNFGTPYFPPQNTGFAYPQQSGETYAKQY